nr:MAG TPA: hypothetical protein [Siphoviridae sp. ctEfY6]
MICANISRIISVIYTIVLLPGALQRTGFSFPLPSPPLHFIKNVLNKCAWNRERCRKGHIYIIFIFYFFLKNTLSKNSRKFCAFVQNLYFQHLLH